MKTILITGAASGIGRETARLFADRGWVTGLCDLNPQGLASLAEEIRAVHGPDRAMPISMDVTDAHSVNAGVSAFLDQTGGRLDLLFNSAGLLAMGHHDLIDLARHRAMVAVNITGVITLIQACLPALKATAGAAVITMSSASAVYGTPELATYSATKHAVRGLTEALNIELAPYDIHVGDIMVSFVRTPMVTAAPTRATSLRRLRAGTSPGAVAETVHRAFYRRKVHWHMGGLLKLLILTCTLAPFAKRFLVKTLAFSHPAPDPRSAEERQART